MNPAQLQNFLAFSIPRTRPVLVKGKPGGGKTDIIKAAALMCGANLIISHPVVSDPTDYKGLPFADKDGTAHFLPFGDLDRLIKATELTVYFLDDLGQAPAAVQAAVMQLLLERRINGHKIADCVTFIAATNRKEDKASVSGILEPVKSRFATIVELDVSVPDWCRWALTTGNMPTELVSFIRFKPLLLEDFVPTRDITNSPSPRTIAAVGRWQKDGLADDLQFEVFKGAAGEGFAAEYTAFLKIYRSLPNIDQIFLSPDSVDVPTEPSVLYATIAALASRTNETNCENSFSFINRMPAELGVACVKDMTLKSPALLNTRGYANWAVGNGNVILN